MDKDRLKLIIKNLESLVECLKSEVYSEPEAYIQRDCPEIIDYDEVYIEDDDGYQD